MEYISKSAIINYLNDRLDKLNAIRGDGAYSRKCEVESILAFIEDLRSESFGDGDIEAENSELRAMVADLNLEIRRLKHGRERLS